jgi:hypothetical protein
VNITEELFLLLLKDNGKDESWGTYRDYGLRGAAVADLVVAGRIALSTDKDPRLQVLDAAPTGDPVLDLALTAFAAKDGKRLSSLITLGKLTLQPAVAQELARRGIITIGEPRMLGLVPAVYPTINAQPERATRARLASVLRGGSLPSEADLALLGILQGLDVAPKVLATEAASGIPLIHIADATAAALVADGRHRVGLLATAFTMEERFSVERLEAAGLEVAIPTPTTGPKCTDHRRRALPRAGAAGAARDLPARGPEPGRGGRGVGRPRLHRDRPPGGSAGPRPPGRRHDRDPRRGRRRLPPRRLSCPGPSGH